MRSLAAFVLLIGSLAVAGCGGGTSTPHLTTVPVTGKLLVDGKPFGPCTISLSATAYADPKAQEKSMEAALVTTSGVVGEDGTFKLTTYKEGDGAPEGTYQVSISADMSKMQMSPVPVCKSQEIEIKKPADGKPLMLDVNLESTGETSIGGIGSKAGGRGP